MPLHFQSDISTCFYNVKYKNLDTKGVNLQGTKLVVGELFVFLNFIF